jgi:hypothetical protein
MILRHILPQDIDAEWSRVRAGLERIVKRRNPDWIPEHLYRSLANDTARLAMVGDDGFLIWERYPGADNRGQLFIVACEGRDMMRNYEEAMGEVVELAKRLNCRRIRHISERKGWGAKFWRPVGFVYEYEVK